MLDPDRVVLEIIRVPRHGLVEVELALFHQLQDQDRRERLGQRGDVVERVGRGGDALLDVRIAETPGRLHFAILHHHDGQAGDLEGVAVGFDLAFEGRDEGSRVLRCRRRWLVRSLCSSGARAVGQKYDEGSCSAGLDQWAHLTGSL